MSEKPLANVVLCCTSVTQDERSSIIRQAIDMGAISQADLTSDVTHLIAARIQTEKYRFAARHRTDIKLVTVDWIPAIHAIWMSGRDVNLPLSEKKYRLPIFHGLKICVTNFDVDVRMEIEQLVGIHGGVYTGDLTKENTHLVAGSATGKKWEAVNSWETDICIVGLEWIHESIKRGAALDEKYFRLELVSALRGKDAWFPPRILPKSDQGLSSDSRQKRKHLLGQPVQRKRLMKRSSTYTTDNLWTEIFVAEETKAQTDPFPQLPDETMEMPTIPMDIALDFADERYDNATKPLGNASPAHDASRGIFHNCSFYVDGFASREDHIVRKTIATNGGCLTDTESDGVLFVVPQNGSPPTRLANSILVTEYWLERCLTLRSFEPPEAYFPSAPFSARFPIPRMEQISICVSGFTGIEIVHIQKLVNMCGALFFETLTKDRSILLASSRECRKYMSAKQQGTRVVKVEWLWNCIKRGKLVGIAEYAMDGIEGSACKIDGGVLLRQRRSTLLVDMVFFITDQYEEEQTRLIELIESMGGQVCSSISADSVTHVIGILNPRSPRPEAVKHVSSKWLLDTFNSANVQADGPYQVTAFKDNENIPPDNLKLAYSTNTEGQIKLAQEMKELRKRLNSAPVRKVSRRILGRAATLPQLGNVDLVNMIITHQEADMPDPLLTACSQGVVYSDPEAAAEKRRVLAKLAGTGVEVGLDQAGVDSKSAVSTDQQQVIQIGLDQPGQHEANYNGKAGQQQKSMRAVGLGDTRKLRR